MLCRMRIITYTIYSLHKMMKLIIYKSLLGSSRIYAQWLSKAIKADVYPMDVVTDELIEKAACIIIIAGTYFLNSPIISFTKSKWRVLREKRVYLINIAGFSIESVTRKIVYNRLPVEIKERVNYYDLQGKIGPVRAGGVKIENIDKLIADINQ